MGFESLGWKIFCRREWRPTLVFLPGKFHGQRNLAGYTVPGVAKCQTQLSTYSYRFLIAFLPRNKCLLISCLQYHLQWFGAQEKKICHYFHFSPSICHEMMKVDVMVLVFWMLSFRRAFLLSSFTLTERLTSSSSLSTIWVIPSAYLRLLIFLPAILIPACQDSSSQHFTWCTLHIS